MKIPIDVITEGLDRVLWIYRMLVSTRRDLLSSISSVENLIYDIIELLSPLSSKTVALGKIYYDYDLEEVEVLMRSTFRIKKWHHRAIGVPAGPSATTAILRELGDKVIKSVRRSIREHVAHLVSAARKIVRVVDVPKVIRTIHDRNMLAIREYNDYKYYIIRPPFDIVIDLSRMNPMLVTNEFASYDLHIDPIIMLTESSEVLDVIESMVVELNDKVKEAVHVNKSIEEELIKIKNALSVIELAGGGF